MGQSAEDRDKELKELTLPGPEIEKQKNRKLQQEMDILKQKVEKLQMQPKAPPPPSPAAFAGGGGSLPSAVPRGPGSVESDLTQFIDAVWKESVAGVEVEELRTKLESLTHQDRQAEQEKWDIAQEEYRAQGTDADASRSRGSTSEKISKTSTRSSTGKKTRTSNHDSR